MKLPGRSYQGRELQGVEIAKDVHAADEDGRPVYLVVALHHAREWPSAEAAMEFAITLAKGYGNNARITSLLRSTRVVVVPLINPDGFVSSRGFPADPADVLGGGGDHAGSASTPTSATRARAARRSGRRRTSAAVADLRADRRPALRVRLVPDRGIAPPGGIFTTGARTAPAVPDPRTPCELQHGVDPNRNYGQFWGGPGSTATSRARATGDRAVV